MNGLTNWSVWNNEMDKALELDGEKLRQMTGKDHGPYDARSKLIIDSIYGNCPVQAEGTIDGDSFYFRARGSRWSFSVGKDPVGSPDWSYTEPYGDEPYDAGWMTEREARDFINRAGGFYFDDKYDGEFEIREAYLARLDADIGGDGQPDEMQE